MTTHILPQVSTERFSMEGRRILYTGAAGGLGLLTTIEMLQCGAQVVVLDKNPEKIEQLVTAAAHVTKGDLTVINIDLSNHEQLAKRLADLVAAQPFDVLINNAAIYPAKPFDEYTMDEHRLVQSVNVEAALVCMNAVLPGMRSRNWGRIINLSSITFYGGWENLAPYVQSKGALVGLARAWAREFGKWGITSNCISPGAFPTDAEKIHPNPEEYRQYVLDHQSVKRRGSPRDIASAIMFLSSDEAGFVTGQTLNVDGGWVMK